MIEFVFTAITMCSTSQITTFDLYMAEHDTATDKKCEIFKEVMKEDVICTKGGNAILITLDCYKKSGK